MESKTVTIYKTTAIGKTQFMFTSGQADPLNLECSPGAHGDRPGARRFFVVEGAKTAEAIAIANSSDVVVVPPNA